MTARLATWFVIAAWSITPARARAEQLLELRLDVGEQRVIPSADVTSYSEGVPGIVDVRLTRDGSSFVVVGQRAGQTSLLLMLGDGKQLQYRIIVGDESAGRASPAALGSVTARENIRLDFYFIQLSTDDRTRIGISWPASFGGGQANASFDLMSGSFTEATAVVTDQALPRLDLAQARGWAKLLRQAAVIAQNGSEASFAGGGELNLPVQTALSVGVRQIPFGSQIKLLPRYDATSGRIELTIHAEVSDLSDDRGSGIPGRVTSSLDSVVNLELGQALVLAGLRAQSEASEKSGVPGLSQLPIIGPLFGSQQRSSEHTENLILIAPSVIDAVALEGRERVREALAAFREYGGELERAGLVARGLRAAEPRRAPEGAKR